MNLQDKCRVSLQPHEIVELRRRLNEKCDEVAITIWGAPDIRTRSELRWGKRNGSLALALAPAHKRGLWRDRASDEGGDLLGALKQACGGSFARALEMACELTGFEPESESLTPEERRKRAAIIAADQERRAAEQAKRQAEANAADAAEIAKAEALWSARRPLAGTPGHIYLTETRAIPEPAGSFGDDVTWHPAQRAVMFAARSASGRLTAVQLIRVTDDGKKRVSGLLTKKTVGRLQTDEGASTLRLAAGPDGNPGVLLHAEGAETGLSVAAATGFATWVAFGSRFDVQHDVLNIICSDDDAPDSNRAKAFQTRLEEWKAVGIRFQIATPWAQPRGDASDFNDVMRERGADEVRERILAAIPSPRPSGPKGSNLPAYYPAAETSLQEALQKQEDGIHNHWRLATRISAARRELHRLRAEAIAKAGGEEAVPPAIKARITKQIHRATAQKHGFGDRIPLPPRTLFSGAQGSGKTRTLRQLVHADGSPDIVWFTEPTSAKAAEEFAAYNESDLPAQKPAMLIRGRSRPDPQRPGHSMCDRDATAEAVAKAGLSVVKALCLQCPFRGQCGDQRQRREAQEMLEAGNGAVFFMAGEYLRVPAPVPLPDHAILDESHIIPAIKVSTFKLSEIRGLHIPNRKTTGINVQEMLREVVHAVESPWSKTPAEVERLLSLGILPRVEPMALAYLRKAGITLRMLNDLAAAIGAEIEDRLPDVNGGMADSAISDALEAAQVGPLRQAHALVTAVAREFERKRETLNGVVFRKADDEVQISSLRPFVGISRASLTVLDGTGDLDLSRKLHGAKLAHVETRFPRQMEVIGTIGKLYSRQSIIGQDANGKAMAKREGDAGKLRGDIAKILARFPQGSMVCGSKRVIEALAAKGALPQGTLMATFAALRGINKWEASPAGLFIGAETISLRDLEAKARAYMVDDDEPFVSMDVPAEKGWGYKAWPYKATRMRRMRDGTLEPVEVEVHPDPRVQAVHEQIREAELLQAVDRLRAIWHQREIILMNDLCLDVTYDVIYRHKTLVAGGTALELAYQASGVISLSPVDLHRLHPGVFRSISAAEDAIKNYRENPNRGIIWKGGVVSSYRRKGQRGPSAKLVIDRERHPDVHAALLAALGPLKEIDGKPVKAPEPTPAASPSADVRPRRPRPAKPRRPFWTAPVELPPVPDWTPPAWMVAQRIPSASMSYPGGSA